MASWLQAKRQLHHAMLRQPALLKRISDRPGVRPMHCKDSVPHMQEKA